MLPGGACAGLSHHLGKQGSECLYCTCPSFLPSRPVIAVAVGPRASPWCMSCSQGGHAKVYGSRDHAAVPGLETTLVLLSSWSHPQLGYLGPCSSTVPGITAEPDPACHQSYLALGFLQSRGPWWHASGPAALCMVTTWVWGCTKCTCEALGKGESKEQADTGTWGLDTPSLVCSLLRAL